MVSDAHNPSDFHDTDKILSTTCCDGWKKIQRKRARVGDDDDTNCYSIPLRRSTRSRMSTTK